jgi:hypothetical protein
MPIDFACVPPRLVIPDQPQPSRLLWAILLIVIMSVGAALAILLWPTGQSTSTAWFWLCVLGYPASAWGFLLCCYLAISYAKRSNAIAHNVISASEEVKCHERASKPLVVLGHAWCFSADDNENSVDDLIAGNVRMVPRTSRAAPGVDVAARWLEIPGKPFYAGNELTEYARHGVIIDWLLKKLVDRVSTGLTSLPARTVLHVSLSLQSAADLAEVRTRVQELVSATALKLRVEINASKDHLSLFETDAWHDRLGPHDANLLIAINLRNAVSERLQHSAAEAGVALLLAHPGTTRTPSTDATVLHLHRPAIGQAADVAKTLELASRWGKSDSKHPTTFWNSGLSQELVRMVKSDTLADAQTQWVDLDTTVGNCAGVGAWLATALALEQTKRSGDPQLVLTQDGDDLIALVCRKQT